MVLGNEKGYFFLPWLQRANEGGRREKEGSAFHQSSELPRDELFPEPPLFHCWKCVKRSKKVEEILGLNGRFWNLPECLRNVCVWAQLLERVTDLGWVRPSVNGGRGCVRVLNWEMASVGASDHSPLSGAHPGKYLACSGRTSFLRGGKVVTSLSHSH